MQKFTSSNLGKAILSGIGVAIAAVILWPLFDIFYCNVISKSTFVWNAGDHLAKPILTGCIFAIIDFIVLSINSKKTSSAPASKPKEDK